jgi:hypothetical protein
MTFFWGNSRLANSKQHSSGTLKKSPRKLPTCAVQSTVKVNSNCRGRAAGESCSLKEKGRMGGNQSGTDFEQDSPTLTVTPF